MVLRSNGIVTGLSFQRRFYKDLQLVFLSRELVCVCFIIHLHHASPDHRVLSHEGLYVLERLGDRISPL